MKLHKNRKVIISMKLRKMIALFLCMALSVMCFTACAKDDVADEPVAVDEEEQQQEEDVAEILNEYIYSGEELLNAGRPLYNNDMEDDYSVETLSDTGVTYSFLAGEAIRGVLFENLSINPEDYNTISCRVRSLTGDEFFRWRCYVHSDAGGNLQTYKDETQVADDYFIELIYDGTGTNADLCEATEPDEEGWITVTFDVGELNFWENATTIDGFRVAWQNYGTDQEVSDVTLTLQ